jgi:hypothetical protein
MVLGTVGCVSADPVPQKNNTIKTENKILRVFINKNGPVWAINYLDLYYVFTQSVELFYLIDSKG